jgi:3-methyladenine DNA glycosylase AlkD
MPHPDAPQLAAQIAAEIRALPLPNTSAARAVRRDYTKQLQQADHAFIFALAKALIEPHHQRWLAYELIRYHPAAFQATGEAALTELGQGMASWDTVDAFARTLSGPAWLKGRISDQVIHAWAKSDDLWWRRAALVSTVALNMRSHGGQGDTDRTLTVCRMLVADHEDMIVKAMSWALRELLVHDPEAVTAFMRDHEADLAARVKREVNNKLKTGLKNPKGRSHETI